MRPIYHITLGIFVGMGIFCSTAHAQDHPQDTVILERIVERTIRDTVYIRVGAESGGDSRGTDPKWEKRVRDRRFLLSVKTNIVAIPLINVGVEIPFGRHFSLGFDYYYPWIRRNAYHKECNEMIAYDMEFRYWLGSDRYPKEARLLGHSFGIYGAGGHYDFERNWSGFQGTFFNIGFDWKFAWPVAHGAIHMEVELGLGMIYSNAQPYDVYEPYGDCFRRPAERKIVRWFGPTRAQFTIAVPIYRKPLTYRRTAR